jgi:hypothetical protein
VWIFASYQLEKERSKKMGVEFEVSFILFGIHTKCFCKDYKISLFHKKFGSFLSFDIFLPQYKTQLETETK